ncbi:YjjI family glycine radical enzyme [Ferrimonas senticii]|uniref:YjjI family glycine radical enzyme n=1 Tax=Ferrimonas senticii TaxID=394566 RepID=UPI0003F508C9|nr:YjjI family glycine radical enzyme [Ferrimonas senticii]
MSLEQLQQAALAQICNPNLTQGQKQLALAQLLEAAMPKPNFSAEVEQAFADGILHDMHESPTPFKPRYVLPDYAVAMKQGSEFLELAPPTNLDEAINFLSILYQNVPSVTTYPVFLGHLDQLLEPFVTAEHSDEELEQKIRLFWQYLDRTLPDSFVHANLGPMDSRIGRTILKVDASLKQSVPNLTFRFSLEETPEELLQVLVNNIIECNKPHIVNHDLVKHDFNNDVCSDYGVVSCYNSLPLGGGSHTLLRLNLMNSFKLCDGTVADYLNNTVPQCAKLMDDGMRHRIRYLVEESKFYDSYFLCKEGVVSLEKFSAMFGIYGLAELVNQLMDAQGKSGRYGLDQEATDLGEQIIAAYRAQVDNIEMIYCIGNKPVFHSQSGISSDAEETAGTRIPVGTEPDTVSHIKSLAPLHKYFDGGVSDIFPLEPTVRSNPEALTRLVKGGFKLGLRIFTANLSDVDLIRITGFMVRRSDIEKQRQQAERHNSTVLGTEAVDVVKILDRQFRTVSHEQHPSALW